MKITKNEQIFFDQTSFLNNVKKPYYNKFERNDEIQKPFYQKFTNKNEFFEVPKKKKLTTYLLSETNSVIIHNTKYNLNLGNVKDFNDSKLYSINNKNSIMNNPKKRINNLEEKKENSKTKSILKNKNLSNSYSKKLKKQKSVRFNFSETKQESKEIKENFPLKISKNFSQKFIPKNKKENLNKEGLSNISRKYSNIKENKKISKEIPKNFSRNSLKKNLSKTLVVKLKGRSYEKKDIFFKMNKHEKKLYDEITMELNEIEYSINIKKKLINQKIEKIEDIRFKLYK